MLHLTAKNFTEEIEKSSLPVVVMFYAAWCGKCAMMKPLVEDIEAKYRRRILFCETEIDESPSLADKYGADFVPTFVLFQDGRLVEILKGVMEESTFEKYLQKLFRIC
ncbi:MAG: thioredoxin fold domain-containing protein [Dorea sp.]|jgi:thioredoxin 1|nr:thioredoxin fold domain-containing protein [Dorea sp.]MCI9248775.1 thioredoxin fold domain-containing protein [Dorea sp.]